MKNKQRIINMVKFSTLAAITFVLGMIIQVGYLTFVPLVSITIVHIPVLIGAVVLPFYYVVGLGFVFGLTSFIASYIYGKEGLDLAFQNPIISIPTRMLFAVFAFLVIFLLRKAFKKIKHRTLISSVIILLVLVLFIFLVSSSIIKITGWNKTVVYLIAGVIGLFLSVIYWFFAQRETTKKFSYIPPAFIVSTFIHSLIVFGAIWLISPDAFGENVDIMGFILTALSFNGVIEALVAAIVGTPIVIALSQLEERKIVNDFDVWCR